jgi:Sulfotransferase domain
MVEVARDSFQEYVNSFPRKDGSPPPEPPPPRSERRRRVERAIRDAVPRPVYEATVGYGSSGLRRLVGRNPGRGRMLPAFLVIGAAKGGTTSLFRWLSDHPLIAPPSPLWMRDVPMKEVHFFDYNFYRREDWYRGHFPLKRDCRDFERTHGRAFITGEASASYLSHRWAPQRVKQALPDVKLVVAFRDPVDRAYSQYNMSCRERYENLSFEDAIEEEGERLRPELERVEKDRRYNSLKLGTWSYLQRSRYAEHLERWLEVFPREQFLFLKAEDMFADPYGTLDLVTSFLELPSFRPPDLPRLKDGGKYQPLSTETRARLAEYFRPYNERLRELTGIDFGWTA